MGGPPMNGWFWAATVDEALILIWMITWFIAGWRRGRKTG